VVVLYIILRTGLLGAFQAQLYGLMCTASSYARGIIVGMILWVWGILSIVIEVIVIISGGITGITKWTGTGSGAKIFLQTFKEFYKEALKGGLQTAAGYGLIGLVSLTLAMSYVIILPLISGIPIFCPVVTLDIGTQDQKASEAKFLGEISAATVDCWNMFGGGAMDPLIGIDPPNPKECRILETYINNQTPINVSMIYNYTITSYNNSWPLGSDKLFVYCTIGGTFQELGNKPSDWTNKCSFNSARIYIMFRDAHDYDLVSYGTGVCQGKIPESAFSDVKDAMVWCIEDI